MYNHMLQCCERSSHTSEALITCCRHVSVKRSWIPAALQHRVFLLRPGSVTNFSSPAHIITVTVDERQVVVLNLLLPEELQSLSHDILGHLLSQLQDGVTDWEESQRASVSLRLLWTDNTFGLLHVLQTGFGFLSSRFVDDIVLLLVWAGPGPESGPSTSHLTDTLEELLFSAGWVCHDHFHDWRKNKNKKHLKKTLTRMWVYFNLACSLCLTKNSRIQTNKLLKPQSRSRVFNLTSTAGNSTFNRL